MKRRRHLLVLALLSVLLVGAVALHRSSSPGPAVAAAPAVRPGPVKIVSVPVARPAKAQVVVSGTATVPPARRLSVTDALNDSAAPFAGRMDSLHALGRRVSDETVAALLDCLRDYSGGDGLTPSQRHAFKNDVMNLLRKQEIPVPGLAECFADIYRHDPDPAMQDYALQHLESWRRVAVAKHLPADIQLIDATLWDAASLDDQVAGTAVLTLAARLEAGADQAFRDRLAPLVLALAGNAAASSDSRLTALSICGDLGLQSAMPLARQLAENGANAALKAAALAVLGHSTREEDRAYLRRISAEGPIELRLAATHALAATPLPLHS